MVQATSIPNLAALGHVDDCLDPITADRTCSLAVECWSLRKVVKDREDSINKLKAVIRRLKFANTRSTESYQLLKTQNSELQKTVQSLTSENVKLQSDLLEEKSMRHFQARVIERKKKTISKLNMPSCSQATSSAGVASKSHR